MLPIIISNLAAFYTMLIFTPTLLILSNIIFAYFPVVRLISSTFFFPVTPLRLTIIQAHESSYDPHYFYIHSQLCDDHLWWLNKMQKSISLQQNLDTGIYDECRIQIKNVYCFTLKNYDAFFLYMKSSFPFMKLAQHIQYSCNLLI